MDTIVICKFCNCPEWYGQMRWLSGRMCCRSCYKEAWEREHGKPYEWDDLDGERPAMPPGTMHILERSEGC